MLHKIKSVTPLPGYALLVHFADGCARQYNMAPLLDQIDAFAPLRTVPGLFEQVRTDPGRLWDLLERRHRPGRL